MAKNKALDGVDLLGDAPTGFITTTSDGAESIDLVRARHSLQAESEGKKSAIAETKALTPPAGGPSSQGRPQPAQTSSPPARVSSASSRPSSGPLSRPEWIAQFHPGFENLPVMSRADHDRFEQEYKDYVQSFNTTRRGDQQDRSIGQQDRQLDLSERRVEVAEGSLEIARQDAKGRPGGPQDDAKKRAAGLALKEWEETGETDGPAFQAYRALAAPGKTAQSRTIGQGTSDESLFGVGSEMTRRLQGDRKSIERDMTSTGSNDPEVVKAVGFVEALKEIGVTQSSVSPEDQALIGDIFKKHAPRIDSTMRALATGDIKPDEADQVFTFSGYPTTDQVFQAREELRIDERTQAVIFSLMQRIDPERFDAALANSKQNPAAPPEKPAKRSRFGSGGVK